jgi:hypothetical protein
MNPQDAQKAALRAPEKLVATHELEPLQVRRTLPGGLGTVGASETEGGCSMEKSKDGLQEGGTIRAVAFSMGRGGP